MDLKQRHFIVGPVRYRQGTEQRIDVSFLLYMHQNLVDLLKYHSNNENSNPFNRNPFLDIILAPEITDSKFKA